MKPIEQYTDHKKFIKDYLKENKLSERGFARGLQTQNSVISDIIKGTRAISLERMETFITYFKFTIHEANYFRALVCYSVGISVGHLNFAKLMLKVAKKEILIRKKAKKKKK